MWIILGCKCARNHLKLALFIRSPRLYPLAKGSDRIGEIAASNRAHPLTSTWTQVRGYFRPYELLVQWFNHCQPGILMFEGHNFQNNQNVYITQSKKLFHNSFEITALTVNKCTQYSDVIMSAMAFKITSISTVCSSACSAHIKENITAPRHWPLWGKPLVTGGFP